MLLVDAIKLYTHTLQRTKQPYNGRDDAALALKRHGFDPMIIEAIARCVSNVGEIIGHDGRRYALTQLSTS